MNAISTPKDRLTLAVRHELSRYEIPNEQLQQSPGTSPPGTIPQLETADNFETMGIASYQHIFSPNILADVRGMIRETPTISIPTAAPGPSLPFSTMTSKRIFQFRHLHSPRS